MTANSPNRQNRYVNFFDLISCEFYFPECPDTFGESGAVGGIDDGVVIGQEAVLQGRSLFVTIEEGQSERETVGEVVVVTGVLEGRVSERRESNEYLVRVVVDVDVQMMSGL